MTNNLQEKIFLLNEKNDEAVVIIHNFRYLNNENDVEVAIERDIKEVFKP